MALPTFLPPSPLSHPRHRRLAPRPCATTLRASARRPRHAVIVGGGPAGLATAIALRLRNLANAVTIIEKDDSTTSSLTREFSYLLTVRSFPLLRQIPGLLEDLHETALVVHPYERESPVGKGGVFWSAQGEANVVTTAKGGGPLTAFMLRRSTFLGMLRERMRVLCPEVVFLKGRVVEGVREGGRWPLEVEVGGEVLEADFVVGADGLKSMVRESFGFEVRKWWTASSGLGYKSLLIWNRLYLRKEGGVEEVDLDEDLVYGVFGGEKESRKFFSLISMPTEKPGERGRLFTVARPKDSVLWGVTDVEEGYKLFEGNFPQLDVRKSIAREDMAQFCDTATGYFPPVQRAVPLGMNVAKGGVVLIGDAAHAFPPDAGQGLNSALEDVAVLCDVLEGSDVADAADVYARERDRDVEALVRMLRLAGPYQYGQNFVRLVLEQFNRKLRRRLCTMWPAVFSDQIAIRIFLDKSYERVERDVDATTRRIYAVLVGLGVAVGFVVKAVL